MNTDNAHRARGAIAPLLPLLALLVAALAFGCATAGSGPPTVVVRVTSNVPEATIWVDDHLMGRVSDFASGVKRLGVGFHRIEVRAPGYYSHFQELEVKPGSDVAFQAELRELLQ